MEHDYWLGRKRASFLLAEKATSAEARLIHYELTGLYSIKAPDTNLCYPPLAWQTYDIDYTAAEYQGGKKVKNARITVKHNGQVIHEDVELPNATTAAPVAEGPEPGPIYLQDHGNPVRYRNIWVVEK